MQIDVVDFLRWIKSKVQQIVTTMNSNSTGLIDDLDGCLQYVGGTGGAIALTGVAAATALYYATRPTPEKPLVPLDNQCPIEDLIKVCAKYRVVTDGADRADGADGADRADMARIYPPILFRRGFGADQILVKIP